MHSEFNAGVGQYAEISKMVWNHGGRTARHRSHDDHSICMHSGFCGTRITNISKMQAKSDKSEVLAEITAMIDRCPSGTLAYILELGGEIIERDLPKEAAIIPNSPIWIT